MHIPFYQKKRLKFTKKLVIVLKVFFLGFFQRTCFIFLKNKFSEIFISLYAYYVFSDLNLINYFLDTEVRYTIQLESGTLLNWSPVHYSTGVRCIIKLLRKLLHYLPKFILQYSPIRPLA